MIDAIQAIFWGVAWLAAIGSVLGMIVVPLSLFVEDRIKRGKAAKRSQASR